MYAAGLRWGVRGGRVAGLTADTIAVESQRRRFEMPAREVIRVETRGDSLWNGLAYGAVFGFATYFVAFIIPFVALALAMAPGIASAQQFSPLESPLRLGKRVYVVVDAPCTREPCGGEFIDGEVTGLNPDTITVESEGRRFELSAADVRRVETYGDPVWDGMAYGFALTFAAGYLAAAIECGGGGLFCSQGWKLAAASACGSIGAAVGTIMDAMIRGRRVVFQRDTRASIAPLIGPGAAGVRLSVRF